MNFNVTNKCPKVSVIIPCYNSEQFLLDTIKSLNSQTYSNIELIFIDDGSSDNTLKILNEFKLQRKDIIVLEQDNQGVSCARNNGLKKAKGEFVFFLDSDDLINDNAIARLVESIEDGIDFSYFKYTHNVTLISSCEKGKIIMERDVEFMNTIMHDMGKYGFCCILYRLELLIKYNINFDEDIKYGEDREFLWKYLVHCKSACRVDEYQYLYRNNPKSAVHKVTWRTTDLIYAIKRVEEYMRFFRCRFYEDFCNYMYPRCIWAVCKGFAVGNNMYLFNKFVLEYPVDECMRKTRNNTNVYVAVASHLYLIHPKLFFYAIRMFDMIQSRRK